MLYLTENRYCLQNAVNLKFNSAFLVFLADKKDRGEGYGREYRLRIIDKYVFP